MARWGTSAPSTSHFSWGQRGYHVDWVLILSTLSTVIIGVLMIYSTEANHPVGYAWRQLVAIVIGFFALMALTILPYQIFRAYVRPLYIAMIFILVAVLVAGVNLRGTKGWFRIGPFYFQVVELAKILFVLTIAGYLDRRIQWYSPQSLVVPLLMAMFPIALIIIQPDLSSSLVFFPVALVMFFLAGARTLHLLAICLVGGLTGGIPLLSTYFDLLGESIKGSASLVFFSSALKGGWPGLWLFLSICVLLSLAWWFLREMRIYIPTVYLWMTIFLIGLGTLGSLGTEKALKDYQRKRLVAFVNPNLDPLGGGYNVRQSQIAIGSGRITGKGFTKGTQSRLGFLPSRHTDFIFSVIGEEMGFLRSLLVMGFYFLIIWRGFEISLLSRDRYGSLVAAGFSSMFLFYAVLNLGMTMGMAPVAGVPIPMLSYGGSSVLSSMMAVGILLSIHWRQHLME